MVAQSRRMVWVNRTVPALLADAVAFALALWLLPPLSRQFQNLGIWNSVLMGLFFLMFCFSVYGLKKLRSVAAGVATLQALPPRALGALGVLFALAISVATAYVVGFLDSVAAINRGLLDEPSVTIYLLLTPASWFGLALLYTLVLTSETEANIKAATARYGLVSFLGLLGVNLMGLAFVAVWQAVWARFGQSQAGFATGVPFLLLNLLLFVALLGPPRLIYLSRARGLLAAATFLLLMAAFAVLSAP